MKVLGVDFSYKDDNKVVSICRLSNENSKGGIDLEYICSFKEDKNYNLKGLIYSQVINLGIDYVVIDMAGITNPLYEDLKNSLGETVIGHKCNEENESNILFRLQQCPVFTKLGYSIYGKCNSRGFMTLDKGRYTDLELLNMRALGLANYYIIEKIFEEEKEENKLYDSRIIKEISSMYIKDGIIIKNRFGIDSIPMYMINPIELIDIMSNYVVSIEINGTVKIYYKGVETNADYIKRFKLI